MKSYGHTFIGPLGARNDFQAHDMDAVRACVLDRVDIEFGAVSPATTIASMIWQGSERVTFEGITGTVTVEKRTDIEDNDFASEVTAMWSVFVDFQRNKDRQDFIRGAQKAAGL